MPVENHDIFRNLRQSLRRIVFTCAVVFLQQLVPPHAHAQLLLLQEFMQAKNLFRQQFSATRPFAAFADAERLERDFIQSDMEPFRLRIAFQLLFDQIEDNLMDFRMARAVIPELYVRIRRGFLHFRVFLHLGLGQEIIEMGEALRHGNGIDSIQIQQAGQHSVLILRGGVGL